MTRSWLNAMDGENRSHCLTNNWQGTSLQLSSPGRHPIGMDDLGVRLADYKQRGCEFARWRCVFRISESTPSHRAILSNAEGIARFASICQSQGICPLIEPEVLSEGNHDIQRCEQVTETVLSFVFRALNEHQVFLEGTVLKPNVVTAGMSQSGQRNNADAVGQATVIALQRTVPPSVPGVAFSSGGQTEDEATDHLFAINCAPGTKPWYLTFAFGRALQASAMRVWKGSASNVEAAQAEFLRRVKANGDATCGGVDGGEQESNVPAVEDDKQSESVNDSPAPAFGPEGEADPMEGDTESDVEPVTYVAGDECPYPCPMGPSSNYASPITPRSSAIGIFPTHERDAMPGIPKSARQSPSSQERSPYSQRGSPSSQRDLPPCSPGGGSPSSQQEGSPPRNSPTNNEEETPTDVGISKRIAPTYNPDPNPDVLGHKPELLPEWDRHPEWNKSIVGYKSFPPRRHHIEVPTSEFRLRILKDFNSLKDIRISDSVKLPLKLTLPFESKTPTIIEEVAISSNGSDDVSEQ